MPRTGSKYGPRHQKARERALRAWRPGQPCIRCGSPTWDKASLQMGHPDAGNGQRYGLECAHCNMSAGGKVGGSVSKRGTRTELTCPHCQRTFKPVKPDQTACSAAHAAAIRRGDDPLPPSGRAW